MFVKYQVEPGTWILRQLRACASEKGFHSFFPALLEVSCSIYASILSFHLLVTQTFADFCVEMYGTENGNVRAPPRIEDRDAFRNAKPLTPFPESELAKVTPNSRVLYLFIHIRLSYVDC